MFTRTRAAVYLRISRDDLATGLAVERQREDCLRIVTERGWSLVGEPYVDNAVSASKRTTRRPAYESMSAAFEAGEFDALVCWDLDRLTRQPRQLEDWIEAAEGRGLILVTANGEADLATDDGRLFARIKASVARAEIERKGARQKRANEQRLKMGKPAPGRRRYGYESDGLTPRESEATHVRRMFEHVASGGTLRSMSQALKAEGVDPAPGKQWGPGRVRYILKNPSYGGQVRHLGESLPSATLTPIVAAALAEEVRAILADDARRTTPGPTPRYLGSSMATCGVQGCGAALVNRSGGYMCRENTAHVYIKRHLLDARIRREVALAFLSTGRDLFADARSGAVAPLIAALHRNDEIARSASDDRDEGLLSAPVARAKLMQLRDERLDIESRLERARNDRSASSSLAEVAREVLGDDAREVSFGEFFGPMLDTVTARFEALDLDRQRSTARALLEISLFKGRGRERVQVWHRVADMLNPHAESGD
ncbi:recombinase family protein [Cryobacterium lyxosi]|uniref:recombinase family protein n=1 Tax=Cryobacterium lyxosi TaxID=1259228 RepID=UPI00141AEA54|nr:recombinase family protein [Cryobacterium lyxosi]